jgi:hypothetical protein
MLLCSTSQIKLWTSGSSIDGLAHSQPPDPSFVSPSAAFVVSVLGGAIWFVWLEGCAGLCSATSSVASASIKLSQQTPSTRLGLGPRSQLRAHSRTNFHRSTSRSCLPPNPSSLLSLALRVKQVNKLRALPQVCKLIDSAPCSTIQFESPI